MKGRETTLVIGCCERSSHRARAVLDGTLKVPGCTVRYVQLAPGEMLHRSFTDPELNVAELSLSSYVTHLARGDCPYVLLPVYIARMSPHAAFYARTDRGISSLADLRGKRVGTSGYQRTLNVWARGFLEDEHAVSARDIHWVIKDTPDAAAGFRPDGVRMDVDCTSATLSDILGSGEVDAIIAAHAPACLERDSRRVKRVIEDDDPATRKYFRRTGVFPILHAVGVRRELVEEQPQLASDLFAVFSQAAQLATATYAAHSYGVSAADCATLATFVRYHRGQCLSQRQCTVAELFAPIAMAQYERAA